MAPGCALLALLSACTYYDVGCALVWLSQDVSMQVYVYLCVYAAVLPLLHSSYQNDVLCCKKNIKMQIHGNFRTSHRKHTHTHTENTYTHTHLACNTLTHATCYMRKQVLILISTRFSYGL